MLNVIPYVGPLLGEVIGVLLCVVLKYGAGVGLNVPILAFALIVLAVMLLAQLIDNLVYQPLIYSTSIKSTPLEIFIGLEGLEGGCQKNRQEKDSFHDRGLLFLFSSVG